MKKPEYLKHPKTGRVLPFTQILAERGDMMPCDADGNAASRSFIQGRVGKVSTKKSG